MSGPFSHSSFEDGTLRATVGVARLDAAVTRDFKSALDAAWRPELVRLELNLGTVEFVDSSGVGALLSAYRKLGARPGAIRLGSVRPNVRSMLEMLRLTDFLDVA
jgi:anti-sigma B factor antagonist